MDARDPGELTYRYGVSIELTDEGGETRETGRSFRVGRAAVEGEIASGHGFLRAGRPASLTVTRRDLNGVPRPGAGSWSLSEVRQPERPLLPGDEPAPATGRRRLPHAGRSPGHRWNEYPALEHYPCAAGPTGGG